MSKRDLNDLEGSCEVPSKLSKSEDLDSDEDMFNSGRSLENLLLLEISSPEKSGTEACSVSQSLQSLQAHLDLSNTSASNTHGKETDPDTSRSDIVDILACDQFYLERTEDNEPIGQNFSSFNEGSCLRNNSAGSHVQSSHNSNNLCDDSFFAFNLDPSQPEECISRENVAPSSSHSNLDHGQTAIDVSGGYEEYLQLSYPVLDDDQHKNESTSDMADLRRILLLASEEDAAKAASLILDNKIIRSCIIKQLGETVSKSMKQSLKKSKLTEDKKDREYLLSINPLGLCREFQSSQPEAFEITCRVLLGMKDPEDVFNNQHLVNNVCTIYSIIARLRNKNATGYALLLSVAARDGGLREESLKLITLFCHVRTIQKYDSVLAKDFKSRLLEKLQSEKKYFTKVKAARSESGANDLSADNHEDLDVGERPKCLTTVWDNMNWRSGRRYERLGDKYSDKNYDFMTSLHISERIKVPHLDSRSDSVKNPEDLCLADFCLSDDENEMLFSSLIPMYSHMLLDRYPVLFKSLKGVIVDYVPHQFQESMNQKSEEFTGDIYEKSESKTEELIQMISEYQHEMALVEDESGRAYVRRQLSGDQKTEKNSTFAILSKSDELSPEDRLAFVLPVHEYFHQQMAMIDISSQLFRDNSRGLDGGAFSSAILIDRKKAKTSKGKDEFDSLKDFINIQADSRFAQYFVAKYKLDITVDNTPESLKVECRESKVAFLHNLVKEALRDLMPQFTNCSGIMPDLSDFPVNTPALSSIPLSGRSFAPSLLAKELLVVKKLHASKNGSSKMFSCKLCSFESPLKSVALAHIKVCCSKLQETVSTEESKDLFWNYKNAEFLINSLIKLSMNFERYGNGHGMYVISKFMLPFMNALGHSNYSNTIHRFICRVLCCTTPSEGLRLIYERFVNRRGGLGSNVFKDRRLEFRIRILKKLLKNLGSKINTSNVQKINAVIDIKEKLFHHVRVVHGVHIKSGKHKARSDEKDFSLLVDNLEKLEAHKVVKGRTFGNFQYPENVLDSEVVSQASYFRWLSKKNKEFVAVFRGSGAAQAFPLS